MLIHLTLLLVHTTVVFFETFYAIVITSCKSASMLTLNVISCGHYYWKMHSGATSEYPATHLHVIE